MLDLVFPRRCVVCRSPGAQLCRACLAGLPRLPPPLCERCGAPTAWPVRRCAECAGRRLAFATARSAVAYEGAVRTVVRAWKERGLRDLAVPAAEVVAEVVARPDVDALVSVPPDRERELRRGAHPATNLARELSARWGLPLAEPITRSRTARRQAALRRGERRGNVRGAFVPAGESPPAVCLVDDVYTSGETVNAAASALRRAGAARVTAVSFARAVR